MTKSVANVVIATNTFGDMIARINELAHAMSTKVVTVDEAVTSGTMVINGIMTSNTLYVRTIAGGNASASNTLSITTSASFNSNVLTFTSNNFTASGGNASLNFTRLNLGNAYTIGLTGANATHYVLAVNASTNTAFYTTPLSASIPVNQLTEVNISGPQNFDVWSYNSANSTWFNRSLSSQITALVAANGTIGERIALVDGAPAALNTLNNLAAAINDDPDYHITVTNALNGKSNNGHAHAASDITSGTLALDRGGLNANVASFNGIVRVVANVASSVAAPTGAVVGTTDSQTLTNKTIDLSNNVVSGSMIEFNAALEDGDFVFQSNLVHTKVSWVPAKEFEVPATGAANVAVLTVQGTDIPIYTRTLSSSVDQSFLFSHIISTSKNNNPTRYKVYWTANTSGSGSSVRFSMQELMFGPGMTLTVSTTNTQVTAAASGDVLGVVATTINGSPNLGGALIGMVKIARVVDHEDDTFEQTINVIGVSVEHDVDGLDEA